MKAPLLAILVGISTALAMTGLLRTTSGEAPFSKLMALFAAGTGGLILLHLLTPEDLGFLPRAYLADIVILDLAFSIFLYVAGYWGGLLQLYNLADRGLSLRVLVDVHEAAPRALSVSELTRSYAAGNGLGWMYTKRLSGLEQYGLVACSREHVVITPEGERWAAALAYARRLLGLQTIRPAGAGPR